MTIATLYDVYLTHFDNNVPKQPTITEVGDKPLDLILFYSAHMYFYTQIIAS